MEIHPSPSLERYMTTQNLRKLADLIPWQKKTPNAGVPYYVISLRTNGEWVPYISVDSLKGLVDGLNSVYGVFGGTAVQVKVERWNNGYVTTLETFHA